MVIKAWRCDFLYAALFCAPTRNIFPLFSRNTENKTSRVTTSLRMCEQRQKTKHTPLKHAKRDAAHVTLRQDPRALRNGNHRQPHETEEPLRLIPVLDATPTRKQRTPSPRHNTRLTTTEVSRPAQQGASSSAQFLLSRGLWQINAGTSASRATTFQQLSLPRPPSGARCLGPTSSLYVRSLRRRARANAVPSLLGAPLIALPSQCRADTKVVSTTNCAHPNRGRPSTTSKRRASLTLEAAKSRSRTITLVVTRPRASRQVWAAALSTAKPRLPSTPVLAQAAR